MTTTDHNIPDLSPSPALSWLVSEGSNYAAAPNVESVGGEREVVRLVTCYWRDSRGIHMRKDLLALRRQSSGYQLLEEDADMAGADLVFSNIINLHECEDGVYMVVMCNEYKDWETGHLEDWDYKLVPVEAAGAVGEPASSAEKETKVAVSYRHRPNNLNQRTRKLCQTKK